MLVPSLEFALDKNGRQSKFRDYTVRLLAKGSFKSKADSKYWPICNGGESVGAKETIREKSALDLNEPFANTRNLTVHRSSRP